MGACKPHHSCGMTLPMCPVRPGREEAPLVSITRGIPHASIHGISFHDLLQATLMISSTVFLAMARFPSIPQSDNQLVQLLTIVLIILICIIYLCD